MLQLEQYTAVHRYLWCIYYGCITATSTPTAGSVAIYGSNGDFAAHKLSSIRFCKRGLDYLTVDGITGQVGAASASSYLMVGK